MRAKLSEERRADLLKEFQAFYKETYDEEMTAFRAERVLEFFMKELGPTVYNQGIQDARVFMAHKLEDLDAEFYEPEPER